MSLSSVEPFQLSRKEKHSLNSLSVFVWLLANAWFLINKLFFKWLWPKTMFGWFEFLAFYIKLFFSHHHIRIIISRWVNKQMFFIHSSSLHAFSKSIFPFEQIKNIQPYMYILKSIHECILCVCVVAPMDELTKFIFG